MRAFEAAARCGSFSAAADELCVTQSAISHQIRHLETWLGAPLFVRGKGNHLRLMPHGASLAQALMASFAEIESACRRARQAEAPPSLTIAAIPSVAVCWLIPRLADFRSLHPELRLRILYAVHGQEIDFADVDLALVFSTGTPEFEGARAYSFLPGSSVPVCNPALAAGMRGRGGQDFLSAGLLHDSGVAGGWQEWFTRTGQDAPSALEGPVFEDFNLLRAAALAGQGVALCSRAMIAEDLRAGRLVQLSSVTVHDDYGYYLVVRASATATSGHPAKAFTTWLFAARDGHPPPAMSE